MLDLDRVRELAQAGHTDAEIARQLGISRHTIARRKKDSEAFAAAIDAGHEMSHSDVANALYKAAKRGNVAAIVWYEKTRRGMSDRMETEQHGNVTVRIEYDDPDFALTPAPFRPGGDQAGGAAL